jgi:WhiB family redox-sensing transcriptional regulator
VIVTVMFDSPVTVTVTVTPCMADPDRWDVGGDDPELKALCRGCPRRFLCANDALHSPGIEGMVAGVHIPAEGRGRTFALRQLQSLAAYGGYGSQPEIS